MIEKFDEQNGFCMADCMNKINEVINAVNNQQIQLNNHECRLLDLHSRITALEDPTYHEEPAENVLTMVDNQVTANLPNIDVGELAFLSKENTELKDEIDRLETELIRTRKALDVAVDALKYANKCIKGGCVDWETEIDKALEQITALEQKD